MATPGSEPQAFTPALSVTALHPHLHQHHQHHGGTGGGAGFNLPLNRGLERALEEAANSGGLNLSARKLKEFPKTAAPGHDLSDTVQAGETGRGWPRVCGTVAPSRRARVLLLGWLGRSGSVTCAMIAAGTVARLARRPVTGAGAQGCAHELCLARGKWEIAGDRELVRNMKQVTDLSMKHSVSRWVGKPRQRWPALGQPHPFRAVSWPRPRRRATVDCCSRRGGANLASAPVRAEPGVWLSRPHISVPSTGTPRFSLTRPLRGPCKGSVA